MSTFHLLASRAKLMTSSSSMGNADCKLSDIADFSCALGPKSASLRSISKLKLRYIQRVNTATEQFFKGGGVSGLSISKTRF